MQRGTSVAEKLNLLLQRFPHPEGRPWKGSEIEESTHGLISQQYFSQLKRGRFARPGNEQLEALAAVLGFPYDLWRTEPEQWPALLEQRTRHEPKSIDAHSLGRNFNDLHQSIVNRRTGQPFSDKEIAYRSGDVLSINDIRAIAEYRANDITYNQIIALSSVFEVSTDYWLQGRKDEEPVLDPELLTALGSEQNRLLLRYANQLSHSHNELLLSMAENLLATTDPATHYQPVSSSSTHEDNISDTQ